jgi:hypothetical protein
VDGDRLLMCAPGTDLHARASWSGAGTASRRALLVALQSVFSRFPLGAMSSAYAAA